MKKLSSTNKKLCFKSLTLCFFMLTLCFFNTKLSSALSYESEQGLSFTLNPTIRVTLSSNAMTINDLAPGSTSDSNIIKVTAESNAVAGYTLSSTVGNNTTYNTTNMLHTNGTNTFTNLSSNKASLANFDPSTWGYSYAPCTTTACTNTPSWISGDITGTTNSGYNGLPLYTTANPIKLINATTPGSSAVQFKFGAKADTAQLAGTYSNVINFIGVGKIITTSYTINYNANGGSGAPAQQTGTSTTGAVQISSTQPTKTNNLFKGWCTVDNTSDPSTCTGTGAEIIQPSGMLGLHPGTGSLTPTVTRTLYAVWENNAAPTPLPELCTDRATCMQTMTSCPTTATTVTDGRDGKQYTIAPIGNACWMTTNLDLAGGTALSANDTNVDSSYISSFTTSNNLTKTGDTIILPASTTTSGFDTSDYSYVANSGNASSNCSSAPGCYSYYSWDAATLGSGRSISTDNTNAEQSICPKGWHLPTTYNGNPNNSTDFRKLMIALGGSESIQTYNSSSTPTGAVMSSALQASPNNFLLAGFYRDGSFYFGGSDGYYWSSTSGSNDSGARSLVFVSNGVYSATNYYRSMGYSVRCVLGS